jgi:hypothetical protein
MSAVIFRKIIAPDPLQPPEQPFVAVTVPTPPPHIPGETTMDDNFAANLAKAALAGMPDYARPADWVAGLDHIARKRQRPGETFEQSYVRIVKSDADAAAMYRATQQAADTEMLGIAKRRSAAGRPADRTPTEATASASETLLAERATARAQRDAISFERAYCQEVDTPEGRELFAAAMAR